MKVTTKSKRDGNTKSQTSTGNPLGHYRSSRAVLAKLEKRGDMIVLSEPSNATTSVQAHDYKLLYWDIRELDQYVQQKREQGNDDFSAADVRKDFEGTALCGDSRTIGYASDFDLQSFIQSPTAPSVFAPLLISRRWGMTLSTVQKNIKVGRAKAARKAKR